MLTVVCDSQGYTEDMNVLVYPSDTFFSYIESSFGILREELNDGAAVYAGGVKGDEIIIIYLKDEARVASVEEAMRQFIERRTEHFYGYVPEIVTMLGKAVVATRGNYVALFVCPDPREAERAFLNVFDSDISDVQAMQETSRPEPSPEPEVEDNVDEPEAEPIIINYDYDHDAILNAWKTGDKTNLSEKNLLVLETTSDIIDRLIRDDMSDYEKELVIHDWIIEWASYDEKALDNYEGDDQDPDNANPYGLFVNQRAICKGYTYTFQLFMDMLEIECITVTGVANVDREDHAWNMVRLDDEWYCVDVTWDDPVASYEPNEWEHHTYFNVTSQYLRDTWHFWDEDSVPEATADKYKWRPAN